MEEKIILYSTGCYKCKQLKMRLEEAGIRYSEVNDVDAMLTLGFKNVPMLAVDGEYLDYTQANTWIETMEG